MFSLPLLLVKATDRGSSCCRLLRVAQLLLLLLQGLIQLRRLWLRQAEHRGPSVSHELGVNPAPQRAPPAALPQGQSPGAQVELRVGLVPRAQLVVEQAAHEAWATWAVKRLHLPPQLWLWVDKLVLAVRAQDHSEAPAPLLLW